MYKKKDGFIGQINIVLPQSIVRDIAGNPLINDLYVTDIGFYPAAKHHYRERKKGVDQYILIYVLEGKGWIEVLGNRHVLIPNCFFVIPASVPHRYAADYDEPWTIYWVHFKGSKATLFDKICNKPFCISDSQTSRMADRVQLFNEIIDNLSMGYNQENIEYANLCLGHLLASFFYINQFRAVKHHTDNDLVKKVISYMQANIHVTFKLNELARHFELSSSHFSKIFKQRTRYSPIDYFIHLKVQYACQLLDFSNMRIAEISREVGYEDQFYFSRLFKKAMKVSPRAYRERS